VAGRLEKVVKSNGWRRDRQRSGEEGRGSNACTPSGMGAAVGEPRERRVAIAIERDATSGAGGGRGGDEGGAGGAEERGAEVPVSHQRLHGAAVLPARHAGPFLQPPSERTLRYERPPAWSAPGSPAHGAPARKQLRARRSTGSPAYSPQAPWPDAARAAVRPATAGRQHEAPAWSPAHPPACPPAPTLRTLAGLLAHWPPSSARALPPPGPSHSTLTPQVGKRRACSGALVGSQGGDA